MKRTKIIRTKMMRRIIGGMMLVGLLCVTGCATEDAQQVVGSDSTITDTTEATSDAESDEVATEITEEETTEVTTEAPSPEELARQLAEAYLADMTTEQKVGQLFLMCYRGESAEIIKQCEPGGILFFADFFADKSAEQVTQEIAAFQKGASIPYLIAVDEEGGTVTRVSRQPLLRAEKFKSPQEVYANGGMEAIRADAKEKSEFLRTFGINVNLAPVADVSDNPADFIYARSFGQDANLTADYIRAVVAEMEQAKMGSALKHFPGYGNNVDTHTGIAIDEREYSQFTEADFLPFIAGIEVGADSVLVSHNIVKCMDEQYPASLSYEAHRVLREELGFDGVIMTDDLSMGAITDGTFTDNPAVLAILAGNDLLISGDYLNQYQQVLAAVKDGTIDEAQIDQSVLRILLWKIELGLLY